MTTTNAPSIHWRAIATRAAADAKRVRALGDVDVASLTAHLVGLALDDVPVHLGDVVLAFAAASADPVAQTELHHRVVQAARATLPPAGYPEHVVDDTIGELTVSLAHEPNRRSPLLSYRGQSSLAAWLRTLAARTAIRLVKACRREPGIGDHDSMLLDQISSVDLTSDLYRAELRGAVRRAFGAAVGRLSYFERDLLAELIVRGRSVDVIARSHGVHRATAARWIARARAALDRELHTELALDLAVSPSEISSILGTVQSGLELSVERLLAG
ncbi:MAG: hypothetical protein AB7P03_11375 [Kofleriaceae bacterium]